MASRRVAQTAINWAELAERVPGNQKGNFGAFKTKADVYLRAVLANPESPPSIDWAHYKRLIPVPGMVDNFKKQYEGLKVPYPSDSFTAQVEQQIKEVQAEIAKFKSESEKRIAQYQAEVQHLKSLLPYDQMTMEDFRDSFPEQALDPINRPSFWPHDAEENTKKEPEPGHH